MPTHTHPHPHTHTHTPTHTHTHSHTHTERERERERQTHTHTQETFGKLEIDDLEFCCFAAKKNLKPNSFCFCWLGDDFNYGLNFQLLFQLCRAVIFLSLNIFNLAVLEGRNLLTVLPKF